MTFLDLSVEVQGLLSFWVSLNQMLFLFNFFRYLQIGKGKSKIRCILLCVSNFILVQIMFQHMDGNMLCPIVLPAWLLILWTLLYSIFAVAEQYRIMKWSRSHVSAMSVKEALDLLPTGLCFAMSEGLPLLTNEKMEEIGRELLGVPWLNAKEAWLALRSGEIPGAIQGGEEPIYQLKDGRIYSFRKDAIELAEGRVIVLMAMEVTQEYAMTQELEEKKRKVEGINTRLKSLKDTIEYVTMSRELLQLKVALHDNLGRSLLTAKRYLLNPQSVDLKELLAMWKLNLSHLIDEEPKEWQIPYYATKKEAATLGIDLQIVGTLPEEERLLPVIDQAISAHVINVLRHADGHVAMIHVCEYDREYELIFTNDGKVPEGEISVRGGLGSLKQRVEELGGRLELTAKPRFKMTILLPREQ